MRRRILYVNFGRFTLAHRAIEPATIELLKRSPPQEFRKWRIDGDPKSAYIWIRRCPSPRLLQI